MKKIFLLIITFLTTLFFKINFVDASYPPVHYDIHTIELREDAKGEFVFISGWAFMRDYDHTDPSYTLILEDQWKERVLIPETKGYDDVEKTSLTCVLYTRSGSYPWCFAILDGAYYNGSTGVDGVKKLIEDTRFVNNTFDDNVGFSFKVYLDQFDCEAGNVYRMAVKVSSSGKTDTTEYLRVFKDRIDSRLLDRFVSSYSDGRIKNLAFHGYIQRDPDQGIPGTISGKPFFVENDIYFISGIKRADKYYQYKNDPKKFYYGIYYY